MEHAYWVGDYKQAIYGCRGADTDLTKAVVDAVVSGNNIGCDTYTLDTSYRSLPDIVKLNNAVFSETFSSVLKKENIVLKAHRENKTSEDCLRYFRIENDITVDHQVAKLLCEGVSPNDIAILARDNKTLDGISKRLNKDFSIPTAREAISIVESRCFVLIESLLRIINSSKDLLAKATVAFLVESDFTINKIIEQKLLHDENYAT